MARLTMAAAAAAAFTFVNAQIAKECPFRDVCYSLNIPDSVTSGGEKDIFLQISGPDTYSWIALGQGSEMAGANMFIVYADGDGNVTLSPRLGTGHQMPKYNPDARWELLAGSNVSEGHMTANIRCMSCDTWEGGSMDLTADSASWIGAGLPGPALDSKDLDEPLQKHFVDATWNWNMVPARGGNNTVNPFYQAQQRPTRNPMEGYTTAIDTAHGVMASIAFIALFPSGAILVRFARFPKVVWVHAAIQLAAYGLFICAAGLGIHMLITYPSRYQRSDIWTDPHPKIGLALLTYMLLQACSGPINHWLFGRKGKRMFTHWVHIWGGRLAIILGMINGGFGQKLGRLMYSGYRAAYGVTVTVMGVLFIASIIFAETHRGMLNPSYWSRLEKGAPERQAGGQREVDDDEDRDGHVRMDSMEERERLHTAPGDRAA